MSVGGRKFEVDKANGKVAGVCAGLARTTGLDPNVVRIGFVLFAIIGSFIGAAIVYGILAAVGSQHQRGRRRGRSLARAETKVRSDDPAVDERLRAHDLRMREIDTFVAGSKSRLAREIEDLRN
jgi:phage shock protein C